MVYREGILFRFFLPFHFLFRQTPGIYHRTVFYAIKPKKVGQPDANKTLTKS